MTGPSPPDAEAAGPSPEIPLHGSRLCGGVHFEVMAFVASKASWDDLSDDGLPRYDEAHPGA